MQSRKNGVGHWTIYVCEECGSVSGFPETCDTPLHFEWIDRKPVEVVAVDALSGALKIAIGPNISGRGGSPKDYDWEFAARRVVDALTGRDAPIG